MDDFLHNYDVSGGKMKPSLPGSGPEKLQSLRLAMGRDERLSIEDDDIYAVTEEKGKRERWDVETVLSESCHTRRIRLSMLLKRLTRTLKTIHG